jgi:heme/copper-type cytochrome/quinol oxidase subunit 2
MLNELNFSFRIKSQYNVSFFDSSSSNVVHLLVWQYWWWSLFFFFTVLYFILFFDVFFSKNVKSNSFVLSSLKSGGRWGDLIAGILPVYWCVNILLNSNMILKVLEWQTETSFCVLRVRGKQWYWVYKMSLKNKTSSRSSNYVLGRGNVLSLDNVNSFELQKSLFKKKFIGKTVSDSYKIKNSFIFLNKNKFESFKYFNKKNSIFLGKNNFNLDNFFTLKKNTASLKKFNRYWITIQQQPKTELNYNYNAAIIFKNKIKSYRLINEFLSNSILVKNRLISVDNVLFLPSRKNITIITNSFDVAHSWFVPGLGLKFDCIPGRSTHNSLFITKPGYYFGHCAEVCGRFHHHMPIKIIALNVDHFIYYYNSCIFSIDKKNN